MLSYLSSFAVSCLLRIPTINEKLKRKWLFMFGSILGATNCTLMWFNLPEIDIFGVAILLGITQAILLISSLGMTANLINKNTETVPSSKGDEFPG